MKLSESLEMQQNLCKALNINSNLYKSGIDKAIQNVMGIQKMGMNLSKMFEGSVSSVAQSAQIMKGFQNSYKDSIYSTAKALEDMQNKQIKMLGSAMQAWQSNINMMSSNFVQAYDNMVAKTMHTFTSEIAAYNFKNLKNLDFSWLESLNMDALVIALDKTEELEFDEELEKEIDLQEVETIANSRIVDAKLTAKEQNEDIIFAVRELTESIEKSNARGGLLNNVVNQVLVNVIMAFLIFLFNALNPRAPSNADIKHTIKSTKQIVRTMEVDNDFYNVIRIVAKDELEVRRASSMKSRVKYYLDFGDLVKIEHKNRNWTKISYTNVYTDEREVGWVLTRYIKRLD